MVLLSSPETPGIPEPEKTEQNALSPHQTDTRTADGHQTIDALPALGTRCGQGENHGCFSRQ